VAACKFFIVAPTKTNHFKRQTMNTSRRAALATLFATACAAALTACGGGGGDEPAASSAPKATGCTAAANSKVGKSARLRTLAHLVGGTATLIDSCTLEITNFTYDGLGLAEVYVYGGLAGNYRQGFRIGPNLRGTAFTGQTLRVTLNAGDIDKLDGISIWCVDANANFGDANF
jgi:hypothetical protein